MYKRHSTRI